MYFRSILLHLFVMVLILASSTAYAQTRIKFPIGSYCGQYTGDFRQPRYFVLNLGRGQTLTSRILSEGTQWDDYVSGPSGMLRPNRESNDQVNYRIPVTGDYFIKVSANMPYSSIEFCAY